MIKVERSKEIPESLKLRKSYNGEDVIKQLEHDFYGKCYICGIKPVQDMEVEHLLPHKNGKYPDRLYDWDNLFLSCSHCNGIKNSSQYDENVMNCCIKDPEQYINFQIIDGNVLVSAKDIDDAEAIVTSQLMNDVFNKKNTGIRIHSCQVRIDALNKEMNAFLDSLEIYLKDSDSKSAKRALKGFLNRKSPFAEFKRYYVRKNFNELTYLF